MSCKGYTNSNYYRYVQNKTHISVFSHKDKFLRFEKKIVNGDGSICKESHYSLILYI